MLKHSISKIQSTCVPVEIHTVNSEDVLEISWGHVMKTERGEIVKKTPLCGFAGRQGIPLSLNGLTQQLDGLDILNTLLLS